MGLLLGGAITSAWGQTTPYLGISLTPSANPVTAGATLTLSYVVTNTGSANNTATGVVRTITGLPTGLSGVTFGGASSGASYNSGTGAVSFTGGPYSLAKNSTTLNFTVSFTVPASAASFTAVTTASATNATNSGGSVSTSQTIAVAQVADVTTSLSGPASLLYGQTGSFTVTYSNNGPNVAPSVTRTVTLPAGATSISAPGGSVSGSTITYPVLTNQASGSTASFTFTYSAPASGASLTTTSTTSVSGAGEGSNTAPNSATVTTALSASADVSATLSGATTAPAGSSVTYTATVANTSASTAANGVVLVVQLPTGLSSVSTSFFGTYNATTGQATFPAVNLAPGATYTRIVRLVMPSSGSVTATASSTATTGDAVPANNNGSAAAAIVTTTATQVADVSVAVNGPGAVVAGTSVTYSVFVTNNGPSTATGVAAQLQFAGSPGSVTVSSGSYNAGTNTVTFTVPGGGTLAYGSTLTYTVRYTAPATGTVTATASSTATTANGDSNAANNNGSAAASQASTTVVTSTPSEVCVVPGTGGDVTFTGQVVNAYFPGTATATAGQKTVTVGTGVPAGTTALAPGEMVVLMQMQGADLSSTNAGDYGDGYASDTGSGYLSTGLTAGQYEYGIIASVAGSTITLVNNLVNPYQNANATATAGQRRFQVIRVPQFQSFTLATDLTNVPAWNGSTGGVLVLDVAGQLDFGSSRTISVAGKGFRGGAGRGLTGAAGYAGTDYRTPAAAATNASKGEGIAGTPRYVNNGGTTAFDTGVDGYPGGSHGRGAPGNAGGGGTDTNPTANDENTGGGGGSNAGTGGQGGNGWQSNLPYGGFGGQPFTQASPSRLVMGGGGGAGTTNNSTVDATNPANVGLSADGFASSGSAGGGIVLIRASTVAGTGTIDVSGADMNYVALNDGSGGGGAGGSVLLLANNSLSNLTILAKGGKGGSNTGNGEAHGPGGGGSGGVAFTSSAVSAASVFDAGLNGTTAGGVAYDAIPGTSATLPFRVDVLVAETPLIQAAANCVADVTTSITGPATATAGNATGPYTVTFSNNGLGDAAFLIRTVTLPVGATMSAAQLAALPAGATYNSATRVIDFGNLTNVAYNATNSVQFSFTAPPTTGTTTLVSNTNLPTQGTNQGSDAAANSHTYNLTINAAPLPITLMAFTAKPVREVDAELSWNTASELNSRYWDVERSTDGRQFDRIARLEARGNTSAPSSYHLTDAGVGNQAKGPVYYRLRQVDADGSTAFSPVRAVRFAEHAPVVSLYPNPAAEAVQLDLSRIPVGRYEVRLLDVTGRVVLADSLQGGTAHALNLQRVAVGSYQLTLHAPASGLTLHQRLMKK